MKTSELIKKLNDAGFISYMNDYDMIVISTKNMKFNICIGKDFTELDQLCNDLRFKAIPWFKELIRSNVEEVK